MESFFPSLKTNGPWARPNRTRDEARADLFDHIDRFYNVMHRHSTIGYLSPVEFERGVELA
jgi:putative transposase